MFHKSFHCKRYTILLIDTQYFPNQTKSKRKCSKIHSNYDFKDVSFQRKRFWQNTLYIYIYISTPYTSFSSPSSPRFYTFPSFPFSYFPLSFSLSLFVSPSLVPSPDESPRASIPARFILEQTLGLPTPQPRRQKATMQIYPLFATRSCRSAQPWDYDFWVLEHLPDDFCVAWVDLLLPGRLRDEWRANEWNCSFHVCCLYLTCALISWFSWGTWFVLTPWIFIIILWIFWFYWKRWVWLEICFLFLGLYTY